MSADRTDEPPAATGSGGREAAADGHDGGRRASEAATGLRSVVVTHDSGPDRRTLYPAEADETERLTNWLSADATAFVALDEMR